jgi:sodium transport system permease protein
VNRRVGGGLRTLGLRAPSRRAVVGAVLLGCTFWYINMTVVSLLPLPSAEDSPLQQLVNVPPLWGALLAIAVVPAVCEELVFRGVLVRSIVGPWSVGFAVIVSAAMFAAYHLSILQLVPTFLLGLVLALVAVCSDSAIPTMIAHFLNNAIALTIARGELPGVASVLREHPTLALAGAILAFAAGLGLATSRPVPGRGA